MANVGLDSEVSIECVRSSEFVVGKQNNFNGPVTIVNCVEGQDQKGEVKGKEERVVIKSTLKSDSKEYSKSAKENSKGFQKLEEKLFKFGRPAQLIVLISLLILVSSAIVLTVFLTLPKGEEPKGTNSTQLYFTKQDWGGKPPKSRLEMKLPVPYVVISHTVTPECSDLISCSSYIRNMQTYLMSKTYADISYNFLIDSNGHIYEGRGWNTRNSRGGFVNNRNLDIALIGDYSDDVCPQEKQLNGLKTLLDYGVTNGKISQDYSLLAANATFATLSPGKNVYSVIKHWPHFDPDPKAHEKPFE